jgi:hypothetical protein
MQTKLGVATIQNPATNISLEFFHFILNPEQRRVFQLVTYKHNRQISVPGAGIEPVTPATKRPQTYALGRASIGIGNKRYHIAPKSIN